jgi:hypothetical protein
MTSAIATRARSGGTDILFGVLPAAMLGYALASRPSIVMPLVGFAAALWLFASPSIAAVTLGASIPALQDLTGGRIGVHVAASDILLVVLGARILGESAMGASRPVYQALRPLRFPALQYVSFVGVLVMLHPGLASVLKSTQRLELLVVPLLVGAFLAIRGEHMLLLRGYIVAATGLAVAWPLNLIHLNAQLQKNPTGQLLANAILLLVGIPALRRFLPCLPFLVVGLFLTASRGAILALLVGIAVIAVIHSGRNLRVMVVRTLPLAVTALLVFQWLPTGVRSHVMDLHASTSTSAGYSIYIRDQYQHEATRLIAAHPWTGVGVGNYFVGGVANRTSSLDPHDVILLQASEGGYLFAASFVVLILGAVLALWRLRHIALAASAIAVLVATAAHGLVDVYWVRGTPVLSWLLVGVVCGLAWREHQEVEE